MARHPVSCSAFLSMKRWRTPTGPPHASQPKLNEDTPRSLSLLKVPDTWSPLRWTNIWLENGREGKSEQLVCCGEKQNWRSEDNRELIDVQILCCPWGPWWYPGPGCCWGSCLGPWIYHNQGLHGCPWPILPQQKWHWYLRSSLPPKARVFNEDHAAADAMPIWEVFTVTWDYGDLRALVTIKNGVWIHGPTVPGVCIYICG